jgi:2',3'-cyclic-nucleotide 2'-phosphodiesterase (5'-nucleotidase family)
MRPVLTTLAFLVLALAACDVQPDRSTGPAPLDGRLEAAGLARPAFQLTLLHNNDGESELLPAGDFGGIGRFATVVGNLKREALDECPGRGIKCDVLLVSSGDNFLPGPEFNASLRNGVPFFDGVALDRVGYDALAIGNHEFDFGPDVLADFIESFESTRPPFLSANLGFGAEPRLASLEAASRIARSVVVPTAGGPVGIIGATTPALPFISSPRNTTISADVAAAVNDEVRRLEAERVEHIILISHLQSIAEDRSLIPMLRGVDLVVAGGGDNLLANPGDLLIPGDVAADPYPLYASDAEGVAVPVVTTSGQYRYVGRLVVTFDKIGRVVRVEDVSGPVRVAGGAQPDAVQADAVIEAEVEAPVAASVAGLAANLIAASDVDLDGRRSSVRSMETNQGNLVADALLWQAGSLADAFGVAAPDVAFQNGGGMRDDRITPAGPISELKTFEILPFSNFVSVVEGVTRQQLKEILENAVSRVEFGDGRFAQVAGLSFAYDPAGTPQLLDGGGNVTQAGTRVRQVALADGTPVVVDGAVVEGVDLTVATINFLAQGGDQYPFRGLPFTQLGVTYQQALAGYLEGPLAGQVTSTMYPAGGEGRISLTSN